MPQLEHIEAIEKRLWGAADTLRANSNYASNEYFLPVMGLVFLRHAYSRYLGVKDVIEANLPKRDGKVRALTKEDFSQQSAIFLQSNAQFDTLVALTDSDDRARAIIEAMESIESDYENLRGVLPKSEYQELDNAVLGQLLRTLNPDELKKVSGDVFGRIYEYFLTQFADQKAHDGGEFFTPISLVSLIANVLEPDSGTVLDPACGSGGMFVQSARVVEQRHENPAEKLTFYGLEKNTTTIRLAKMNLAVHGLEGDIQKAISYYEDPHELLGKANFVMANPPFNVDEIDADKINPRLPFGLPGVNKKGKVSYTCAVPCELWFLNRNKPKAHKDNVLMIDARNVYRKVTCKIYDFPPEQQQNLQAIVWLYRGETERYLELVSEYLGNVVDEAQACFELKDETDQTTQPLPDYAEALKVLRKTLAPFLSSQPKTGPQAEVLEELEKETKLFDQDIEQFRKTAQKAARQWETALDTNTALIKLAEAFEPMSEASRDLIKQTDLIYKLATRLIDTCENECNAKESDAWVGRDITRARKASDGVRQLAVEQLKQVRYFWKQAHWLTERFPEAKLQGVDGLVKLVGLKEIEANDWCLTPGRYVGVVPEEEDEDFDFEETLREIHVELEDLNAEAVTLAATIKRNFEELGI